MIFNPNLVSGKGPTGVYRAFCENKDDLENQAAADWSEGSVIVCLNAATTKKKSVHVKMPDGTWNEVEE